MYLEKVDKSTVVSYLLFVKVDGFSIILASPNEFFRVASFVAFLMTVFKSIIQSAGSFVNDVLIVTTLLGNV